MGNNSRETVVCWKLTMKHQLNKDIFNLKNKNEIKSICEMEANFQVIEENPRPYF